MNVSKVVRRKFTFSGFGCLLEGRRSDGRRKEWKEEGVGILNFEVFISELIIISIYAIQCS